MMKRILLLLWLPACWLPLETGKKLQTDLELLQVDVGQAKKILAEQKAQLDEQLQRAEDKIQELNRAARLTDADFGVQLERLIKEMQELRGQNELLTYRLSKIEEKLQKLEAPPSADQSKSKEDLLAQAMALEANKHWAEARGIYRDIVKRWPRETGITDTAYFHLGDMYFAEKHYREALQEYIRVAEQFSTGKFADDAYYQIGLCSMELGNLEDAEVFFNEVVTRYKKSAVAPKAAEKLMEVRKRLAKERKRK